MVNTNNILAAYEVHNDLTNVPFEDAFTCLVNRVCEFQNSDIDVKG